jgi:hypothetical protein
MSSSSDNDTTWDLKEVLSKPRRLDVVWLLLPTLLALGGFGLIPMRSWDYWWHITMGRLVNYWGAVPAANHFLYTMPADAPSYDQPWLAQLLLYGMHAKLSIYGALLVRNLMAAAAVVGLSWAAMRRSNSVVVGSLLTLAALPFLFTYIEMRPHLFAWPLFAGLLWVGYGIYDGRRSPWWLVAFPMAAVPWANLHGSFPLAAVLAGCFGAAHLWRSRGEEESLSPAMLGGWIAAVVASAVAPLANPRGAEIYGFLADQMTNDVVRSSVTEWLPTFFGTPPVIGTLFYLIVGFAAVTFYARWRELDPADAILLVVFAGLAVTQNRALLWFGFVLPVALSPILRSAGRSDSEHASPNPWQQRFHTLFALGLVVTALALQPTMRWRVDFAANSPQFDVRQRAPLKGVVPAETPFEAVELLGRYTQAPRLFHDQRYAGFLLYHLSNQDPRRIVFVDQRIELPESNIWKQYYDINRRPNVWKGLFHQYDVGAAVLSREHQKELIKRVESSPEWQTLIEDDDWSLLMPVPEHRREKDGGD